MLFIGGHCHLRKEILINEILDYLNVHICASAGFDDYSFLHSLPGAVREGIGSPAASFKHLYLSRPAFLTALSLYGFTSAT